MVKDGTYLMEELPQPFTSEENRKYFLLLQSGDENAKELIAKHNISPDDQFDVLFIAQIAPDPRMAVAVLVFLALHADAAMGCTRTQRALTDAEIARSIRIHADILAVIDLRHHVQQIAAVKTDRLIAPEISGPEAARRTDEQEISGSRLAETLVLSLRRAGGNE